MGYRSIVCLALTKHGIDVLHHRLEDLSVDSELREEVNDFFERADKHYVDVKSGAEV